MVRRLPHSAAFAHAQRVMQRVSKLYKHTGATVRNTLTRLSWVSEDKLLIDQSHSED